MQTEPLLHFPNRFCALNLPPRSRCSTHLAQAMNFDDAGDDAYDAAGDAANLMFRPEYQPLLQHPMQLLRYPMLALHPSWLNTVVAAAVAGDSVVVYHVVFYVYASYTDVSLCDCQHLMHLQGTSSGKHTKKKKTHFIEQSSFEAKTDSLFTHSYIR